LLLIFNRTITVWLWKGRKGTSFGRHFTGASPWDIEKKV